MFVYEKVGYNWLATLKRYKKPLDDGLEPSDYWYFSREKQQAIYYIGWVSASIARCDGQDFYEFAFICDNQCFHIEVEIFHPEYKWNERNKLRYLNSPGKEIREQMTADIKEAVIFYLNNISEDRKNIRTKKA